MPGTEEVNVLTALLFGFLSFISPCVLPLIPSYLAFITGISFEDLSSDDEDKKKEVRKLTAINSLFFILGFSIVFVSLGALSTFLGSFLKSNQRVIQIVGGIIIILLGAHVMGLFKIKKLYMEKRVHLAKKPRGIIGSILVGITFAAGWTPCIGPLLGTIMVMAADQATMGQGIFLLIVYSIGLAVPFFLSAVAFSYFLTAFDWIKKHFRKIEIISGVLMILIGILFVSGLFNYITRSLAS